MNENEFGEVERKLARLGRLELDAYRKEQQHGDECLDMDEDWDGDSWDDGEEDEEGSSMKSENLSCSYCGCIFVGEYDGTHDAGFGVCPKCVDETYERFALPRIREAIKAIGENLKKQENREKWRRMSFPEKEKVALKMIERGAVSWEIKR